MKKNYVFEWLDNLINYELNPAFLHPSPMHPDASAKISFNLEDEMLRLKTDLQHQFFHNHDEVQMTLQINKYYEALVLLINKTYEYQHHPLTKESGLEKVLENTMRCLSGIREWLHGNYLKYITLEQALPLPEIKELGEEIRKKKESLRLKLQEAGNGDEVTQVVTGALEDFIQRIDKSEPVTKREADYHKALIGDIEDNKGQHTALSNCPSLHELLVYWNLNSKACIRYFTIGLDNIIKSNETVEEQLEFMRFQMKNITQLPQVPDFIYNPAYPSLKQYFGDYLSNEIDYLETKKIGFVPNDTYDALREQRSAFKVICALSTDQIGIILKAGHDLGLLLSRSLSAVFKAIVPYVSTNQKEELSWQSMRSKSLTGEDRDKEIAIESLQQMILKIRQS